MLNIVLRFSERQPSSTFSSNSGCLAWYFHCIIWSRSPVHQISTCIFQTTKLSISRMPCLALPCHLHTFSSVRCTSKLYNCLPAYLLICKLDVRILGIITYHKYWQLRWWSTHHKNACLTYDLLLHDIADDRKIRLALKFATWSHGWCNRDVCDLILLILLLRGLGCRLHLHRCSYVTRSQLQS